MQSYYRALGAIAFVLGVADTANAGGAGGSPGVVALGSTANSTIAMALPASESRHDRAWRLALENPTFLDEMESLEISLAASSTTNAPLSSGTTVALSVKGAIEDIRSTLDDDVTLTEVVSAVAAVVEVAVRSYLAAPGTGIPGANTTLSIAKVSVAFGTAYTYHRFFE